MFRSIASMALAVAAVAPLAHTQSTQFFQQPQLLPDPLVNWTRLGTSLDVDGVRFVAGGPEKAMSRGTAFIFEQLADGSWTQVVELSPSVEVPQAWFGKDVALDGDLALVGAPREEVAGLTLAGAAYLFERGADGAWTEVKRFLPDESQVSAQFGLGVAICGDRVLIGSPGHEVDGAQEAGTAFLYERGVGASWDLVARIDAQDPGGLDRFGSAVALDGDRAAIGSAGGANPAGTGIGFVQLMRRAPDGSWTLEAELGGSGHVGASWFRCSMALEGERLVVGWDESTGAAPQSGAAFVFERDAGGAWGEVAKLQEPGGTNNDNFGFDVDLEGDLVAVGNHKDWIDGEPTGSITVFRRDAGGVWSEVERLVDDDDSDWFGYAVAVNDAHVFGGTYFEELPGVKGCGGVEVFRFCDDCTELVGVGAPGCDGAHTIAALSPPILGWAPLTVEIGGAPVGGVGFLALADAADPIGSDPYGLGVPLHLDLVASSVLVVLPLAGELGTATLDLPLPSAPGLAGTELTLQSLWIWSTCALPPLGLSSSPGLKVTLGTP